MCMFNLEKHDHDEPIDAWKTVLRLKDGSVHSIWSYLHRKRTDYTYTSGNNMPEEGTLGLHTYIEREHAEDLAECTALFPPMPDDVAAVEVYKATIPSHSTTRIGDHANTHRGYISSELIVNTDEPVYSVAPRKGKLGEFTALLTKVGIMKK